MSRPFSLPLACHPVVLVNNLTTNGGVTSLAVTLKHTLKCWLYVYLQNAAARHDDRLRHERGDSRRPDLGE